MWSKNVNEIVSTHGYSLNQIIVWRYPSMSKVSCPTDVPTDVPTYVQTDVQTDVPTDVPTYVQRTSNGCPTDVPTDVKRMSQRMSQRMSKASCPRSEGSKQRPRQTPPAERQSDARASGFRGCQDRPTKQNSRGFCEHSRRVRGGSFHWSSHSWTMRIYLTHSMPRLGNVGTTKTTKTRLAHRRPVLLRTAHTTPPTILSFVVSPPCASSPTARVRTWDAAIAGGDAHGAHVRPPSSARRCSNAAVTPP